MVKTYDLTTANYFAQRNGMVARTLVRVRAKNRSTGDPEELNLWDGHDHQSFITEGESRVYYGAGTLVAPVQLTYQTGMVVRIQTIKLSPISAEVEQLIRGYEPRLAPVWLHRVLFDPDTLNQVSQPHRIFRGWIDSLNIRSGAIDGESSIEVKLASASRELTRRLGLGKSDSTQKLRSGDRFYRNVDVGGRITVYWGEHSKQTLAASNRAMRQRRRKASKNSGMGFDGR